MFQCQCQLGPSSSLSHWRCCPDITQKTHVFEVTKNGHKKKSHYLWMKEKLCTRQIVHCLQRFDLSQLVQDLSSINLNDPWISSHFLGFPLDTGVFFCLTNFQRKKRAKRCPACPIPTQPVGGTVQKSHARDDHKVHHQRYSLNLTSLAIRLDRLWRMVGWFFGGEGFFLVSRGKNGPTWPTP